jgi:hypothetical protein
MSRAGEVSDVLRRAGIVLPPATWTAVVFEIDNIYNNEAALSRAIAHIRRGLDIISEMSHPDDTIEDNDRS